MGGSVDHKCLHEEAITRLMNIIPELENIAKHFRENPESKEPNLPNKVRLLWSDHGFRNRLLETVITWGVTWGMQVIMMWLLWQKSP